jgi:hypothetical protein
MLKDGVLERPDAEGSDLGPAMPRQGAVSG